MNADNLIKLDRPVLIARVSNKDLTPQLTLKDILTSEKEGKPNFTGDIVGIIVSILFSIAILLPAAIYDIVNVFISHDNFSGLLFLSLDTKIKVFFYLMFLFGIVLFIIVIIQSTLKYMLFTVTFNKKNYKYNCVKSQNLLTILLNEVDDLDKMVSVKWKRRIVDYDDESFENDDPKGKWEFYLSYIRDYWDPSFMLQPSFRDKIGLICIPFFLLTSAMILIGYIEKLKGNYSFIGILCVPLLFVILLFSIFAIKKKKKSDLGFLGIFLAYTAFIINNIMIVLFIIFANVSSFSVNDRSTKFITNHYNIALFAFSFYLFLVLTSMYFSTMSKKGQIDLMKKHYTKKVIEIEKTIALSNESTSSQKDKLSIFYKRKTLVEETPFLPFKPKKIIFVFSTYVGFISLLSGVLTYLFSIL